MTNAAQATSILKLLSHTRYLTTNSLLRFWARALGNSKLNYMRQ